MCNRVKRLPELFLVFLIFGCLSPAFGQSESQKVYHPSVEKKLSDQDATVSGLGERFSTVVLMSQVFVFLVILAGGALLLRNYARRGKLTLKPKSMRPGLVIAETKPLANRQYLVVVEHGDQRMLLGVGPGIINNLCFLNTSFEQQVTAHEEVEDFEGDEINLNP